MMAANQPPARDGGAPQLSVVVALIAGGQDATRTCLTALERSARRHRVECIVPYDARLDGVPELAERFPWVDFIDARAQVDATRFGNTSREHHDLLRAIGLRLARGAVVGLLEDHGTPCADWCSAVLEAHQGPAAAVGGALENGVDRLLNWAVYYCDFGRYQNPLPAGTAEFVSDSNVAYKRAALDGIREVWSEAFHETSVKWALRARGELLQLDPRMVVYQTRRGLRLLPALRERFVWGRSFAATRFAHASVGRRLLFVVATCFLPVVLSWRIASRALRTHRHLSRLLLALPLIGLLEIVWSIGEFVGYSTGRTGGPQPAAAHTPEAPR
jgi:hypothetical protein